MSRCITQQWRRSLVRFTAKKLTSFNRHLHSKHTLLCKIIAKDFQKKKLNREKKVEFGGKEPDQSVLWGPTVAATSRWCDPSAQVTISTWLTWESPDSNGSDSWKNIKNYSSYRPMWAGGLPDTCPAPWTASSVSNAARPAEKHAGGSKKYEKIFSTPVTSVNVWSPTEKVLAHCEAEPAQ